MANAEHQGLYDLFAAECGAHLDAMRAQLAVLAGGAAAAPSLSAPSAPASSSLSMAAAAQLRDTLHTLAGAARAVELLDLEYLCRALESLADGPFDGPRLALLADGVALAPQLLATPVGRVRNQMMALVSRCKAAADPAGAEALP